MYSEITASYLNSRAAEAKSSEGKPLRLAILGHRSTNILAKYILASFKISRLNIDLYESSYNQVEMELLNPKSALYDFNPEAIIIINSYDKEYNSFFVSKHRSKYCENYADRTESLVQYINDQLPYALVFMDNFEETLDHIFGHASNETKISFANQLRRINVALMDLAERNSSLHIFDKCSVLSSIGLENARDNGLLINVDIPYKMDVEAKLAWGISQQIATYFGRSHKCLILDLDNTIWGGIIGDDGIEGIQLGNNGLGKAYRSVQIWAKELKQRGVILAVSSKNNEEVVLDAFDNLPEMILKMEDFSIIKANWNNKAENIQEIKNALNIGFDSMVFIDDNPVERELVRKFHPEVCVPELPKDPANYIDYLRGLNLFEMPAIADSTVDRTKFFQDDAKRAESESTSIDLKSFLEGLELKATIMPFTLENTSRISELSLRSNQFNLRTIRYQKQDVERLIGDESYSTYSVDLEDKFGTYGIISLVVLKAESEGNVFIENWLMSCRAMQREVELLVLNAVVQDCFQKGVKSIIGRFESTEKNGIVKNFYSDLGFAKTPEGDWKLDINSYVERGTSISTT